MNLEQIKPSLPITVPYELHCDMAEAVSEAFAVSYLCGALVVNGRLLPRTYIARERLLASSQAKRILDKYHIVVGPSQTKHERTLIPSVTRLIENHDQTGKFRPTKSERPA